MAKKQDMDLQMSGAKVSSARKIRYSNQGCRLPVNHHLCTGMYYPVPSHNRNLVYQ